MNKLLFARIHGRLTAALWDGTRFLQLDAEEEEPSILGNIYIAKVKNVVKNIFFFFFIKNYQKENIENIVQENVPIHMLYQMKLKRKLVLVVKKLKDKNFITKKEYAKIAKIFLH